ncbi:MAG: PP2C family protein-serine/threonine phosphatase, partial [Nitrospinota bacterium]|nr:PP2C family protein-serine/threonine phosphatase [Nitrospinota bacterium]
ATSILYAYEEDAFSFEDLWRNVVLTYAMTNIMLNVLLRRKADNVCHELDEELKTIGSIQRQLLPAELPDVEGYEWAVHYSTSARAGGDYYDFFLLPENKIGIIIADVSGHGSPAAVVMAMTRLLLHTYPGETAPPLEVFRNINNHLVGNILPGQFITGFYGIIDDTNKTFTYSNAGHCPPQLFRVKSCSMEKLQTSSGMPLSIMNDGRFEQKSIGLNPEDALVFYTDGLSEAMNNSKEMYGERRLQEVLKSAFMKTAEEIKEAIIEDFNNFLITLL